MGADASGFSAASPASLSLASSWTQATRVTEVIAVRVTLTLDSASTGDLFLAREPLLHVEQLEHLLSKGEVAVAHQLRGDERALSHSQLCHDLVQPPDDLGAEVGCHVGCRPPRERAAQPRSSGLSRERVEVEGGDVGHADSALVLCQQGFAFSFLFPLVANASRLGQDLLLFAFLSCQREREREKKKRKEKVRSVMCSLSFRISVSRPASWFSSARFPTRFSALARAGRCTAP